MFVFQFFLKPKTLVCFQIASCNGCKAFFRRTVITGRQVACKKWGTCLEEEIPIS